MGAMPNYVEKSPILEQLDYYTKLNDAKAIGELIKVLEAYSPMEALLKAGKFIGLTAGEVRSLRNWLLNPNGWAIQGNVTLPELIHTELLKALNKVRSAGANEGLQLDSYWVCYPPPIMVTNQVEVRSLQRKGAWALGFDILTPGP